MANTGLLLLFFAGVTLVIVNEMVKDRVPEVEYRYLPRDLDTYLREEPRATLAFESIFKGDKAKRFPDTQEIIDELQDETTWRKFYEIRRRDRLPTAEDMKDITAWYKRIVKEFKQYGPGAKKNPKPAAPARKSKPAAPAPKSKPAAPAPKPKPDPRPKITHWHPGVPPKRD